MNEDEAIRILQGLRLEKNMEMNSTNILKERFAEQQAAINMAIAALENQIAKEPVKADVQPYIRKHFADTYICPVCHKKVEQRWNGCPYCLQRLKWEE